MYIQWGIHRVCNICYYIEIENTSTIVLCTILHNFESLLYSNVIKKKSYFRENFYITRTHAKHKLAIDFMEI